jgi:hypothetical protein
MEDDLKKNENGRQPDFFLKKSRMTTSKKIEDVLKKNGIKWKTTSKIMKDDHKKIGRQPQKKWKMIFKKI